ncbi:MAG TPA: penicillin-binding protein activator, partial [Beijerinckiaceae bacterium]|nr:penicillin-binding protein activator [Beijerinckiaceae bacterium]
MFRLGDRFDRARGALPALLVAGASLVWLAGCAPSGPGQAQVAVAAPGGPTVAAVPTIPVQTQPLPGGANMGSGPIQVGLILPLTANGAPSVVGVSLRNAAQLALEDVGSKDITLAVEDDQSTPEGASAAAQAALAGGAKLLIGPLFAPSVREAGRVASAANVPMIAFSTDASTASPGVYLLSFLIESYVDRIVDYAAAHGKKSFAALIPNSDYGRVAEAEFMAETARVGARVQAVEHYDPGQAAAAIQRIASSAPQIDALFIPEQAQQMTAIAPLLAADGLASKRIQILGTGLWDDARVLNLPALQGAWFAAPDNKGFTAFAAKYRARFGSDPTRIATLARDAVALAAALARTQGQDPYSERVLTSPAGFKGVDGVFRFRQNGL